MASIRRLLLCALAATLSVTGTLAVGQATASAGNSPPVTGAAFTSTNTSVDGTGHCKNGNEDVNCNIYDGKEYVWLNGGPQTAYVGDGSYFFAVLAPGGQADPNDGSAKNLSDDFDLVANRTFTVAGSTVTYAGTHDFDSNKIRLFPYADTPNPGGVYILAICSLDKGYPVMPSRCKYDAFKVQKAEAPPGKPLTVTKDATGSYDTSYDWSIAKDVDKTVVKQIGGNVTFTYTVTATRAPGMSSNASVTGTIQVFNPNEADVAGVDISDQLSDGTVCTVANGSDQTVPTGETDFAYTCDLTGVPQGKLANTVTISWPEQFLGNGSLLDDGSANFTFSDIPFTQTNIDDCATFSDTFDGSTTLLGTTCDSRTYEYTRTVPAPPIGYNECSSYSNTATFETNATHATGSASKTVKVCGPAKTGARNMAYWKNSDGQWVISGGSSTGGACNVTSWLRQLSPYQDLGAGASCSSVAGYVSATVKAAATSGAASSARLKGQMLATALDVFYSSPALGGNKLMTRKPVGGFTMDLSTVCVMTELSTGAAKFSGSYADASGAFGGASRTVSQMLSDAAAASNSGGGSWYDGDQALTQKARTAFAALNNKAAFRAS